MRLNKLAVAAAAVVAAGSAQAAVINLATNLTGSSTPYPGSSIDGTLDDGFAYDEYNPTATLPNQTLDGALSRGFHGNNASGTDVIINYTLSHTTTALESTIVIDVWGRDETRFFDAGGEGSRDNDFDVLLLNGTTVIGTVSGLSLDQGVAGTAGGAYARATFDGLVVGTSFDGMRIVGHDTGGAAANYFTILETRAGAVAAVPEPSAAALLGLGGLALILRRSK